MELALDVDCPDSNCIEEALFQSLFSWNLLSMVLLNLFSTQTAEYKFQSLFSWNLLSMIIPSWPQVLLRVVSILVFVELALDDTIQPPMGGLMWGFQSLFSWNLLSMIDLTQRILHPTLGFNPCFRGTCSR